MSPRNEGRGLARRRGRQAVGTRRRRVIATLAALCTAAAACAGAAAAPALAGADDVLVVGDSLAVGTKPFLPEMLGGRNVLTAAKSGITTPQGMDIVRKELRVVTPQVVVISLGSNDGSDPRRFSDRLRRTMDLLPADACVIWSTIIRPPRKGEYRGLNRVLHQAKRRDPRIVVVDWEHAVTGGAVFLRDGLHADEAGYRYRSAMIADAVNTQCAARVAAAHA
jgi:lysophospholipase L1-like esterase